MRALFLLLTLLGCASSKVSIDGRWARPCTGQSKETLVYDGKSFRSTISFFDGDCSNHVATMEIRGTYEVGESVETPAGATRARFEVKALTLAMHSEEGVAGANRNALLGATDWVLDEPKDMLGKEFSGCTMNLGDEILDIVRVSEDGRVLTLGDSQGQTLCDSTRDFPKIWMTESYARE